MIIKVNIPGLHNSDSKHWQSWLEKNDPESFIRIHQDDWDAPECNTWIQRVEDQLSNKDHSQLILIDHSIGCMTIVHWFKKFNHQIKAALLVAPTDAEKDGFPDYISGFAPIPLDRLPFPSIVVASDNDHVTSIERAKFFASSWGSKFVEITNGGHIEAQSGFGPWELGLKLISDLEAL